MNTQKKLWFRRKRYGYGWYPVVWQGWAVIVAYLVAVLIGAFAWEGQTLKLGMMLGVLSVALIGISYIKGETPRWQWGGEPKKSGENK